MRELGVRMKFTPLQENLAGRRVVMVDDSIVRGTTTGQIVRLLRDAGRRAKSTCGSARRRSSGPASTASTWRTASELIAAHRTVEEIRRAHRRRQPGLSQPAGRHSAPSA